MLKVRCFFVICFLFSVNLLFASEEVKTVFKFSHLKLSLYQNYSSFRETRELLFKARATVLNNYLQQLIVDGKIKKQKFEISIYDEGISRQHLIIQQKEEGYQISLSGYPTLQQLCALVKYASNSAKHKLEYSDANAKASIDSVYKKYERIKIPAATHKIRNLWSVKMLSLIYVSDSLQYRLNNKPIKANTNANLPVIINNRLLFFANNTIVVIEGKKRIAGLVINKLTNTDYDCQVYSGWVNICDGGPANWLYAYSYKKNIFYVNPKFSGL